MADIIRRSPVAFSARPKQAASRDDWQVVLEYDNEGQGPWLVDLSHRCKWDVQDRGLDEIQPAGVTIPPQYGRCACENGLWINRLNRTQASVWHLGDQPCPAMPAERAYTDTTDSTVFLALLGPQVFAIAEKLSALDFLDPAKEAPFLLQGPFCHVPCQMAVVSRDKANGALLLTCSRGYAHVMVEAILHAGAAFGLRPAGERRLAQVVEMD